MVSLALFIFGRLEARARFLSPILSQETWQITWPRLRSQVTCGVFCLCFLKWLYKSLGPKSLGLFWNAPYCFPSDALLTSPCFSVNTIVTSRVNTIVTSLNAAASQPTMPTMLSQPMVSHPQFINDDNSDCRLQICYKTSYNVTNIDLKRYKIKITMLKRPKISPSQ